MEYLELVLLITVIVTLFRQTYKKIKDTEDQAKNIEDKLEATYKLLKELSLSIPPLF